MMDESLLLLSIIWCFISRFSGATQFMIRDRPWTFAVLLVLRWLSIDSASSWQDLKCKINFLADGCMRGYLSTFWVDAEYYGKHAWSNTRQCLAVSIRVFGSTRQCGPTKIQSSTPWKYHFVSSRICSLSRLYDQPQDFAVLDQAIFDTPLDVLDQFFVHLIQQQEAMD